MTSRMKEEEKNEKIIRGLLKLPANRKCINCNNLGPQYVCTNFWTFICTNCSGLHREFCHRVKSISMAKFTTQEVKALQEGGNEKAREIYFKVWDSQRNSLPDSSHTDRLRDFIKQVYVYRKFTGEKNTDKPPQGKVPLDGERSPAYGNDNISGSTDSGRRDSYRSNSRSPPYNEQPAAATGGRNPNRCFRYVYGERSPAYNQGDKKRSPCRFVVVDDRVRDDKFAGGSPSRKFEERRIPNVLTKSEGSSPSRPKDMFSPSIVGPIRDILGDYAPQLHVVESPKSDCPRVLDKPALTQRSSSSPSLGASDRNPLQMKIVNLVSLIDFDADPEPPSSAAPQQSVQQTTSPLSNGGDWASFHIAVPREATESTVRSGTLDSAVSPLSGHAPSTREEMPTLAICAVESSPIDGEKQPTMQQYQTSSLPADQNPLDPPSNALVVADQLWGSSVVPNPQEPLSNPAGHLSQDLSRTPTQDKTTVIPSSPSVEAKPAGRKELPADLFTALYPVIPASIPGWQMGPHPSIGYGMQYPMGMVHPQLVPTFPVPSKSTNPFDIAGEPALARAPTFPSMEFLQGGLPNVPEPSPLLRSSSFGNPSQQWAASQQSSFPLALSQGQYMVQQVPNNMHQLLQNQLPQNFVKMGHEGTGSPISAGSMYGNTSSMDTQSTGRYSQPASPNSYSPAGGNPFG